MKRPLLLAALVASTGLVGAAAKAEPLQMFNIQTPGAGMINFSGTGTANFNQSLGTSNSFNVGTSTNLGVNASASSTEDYTAVGSAELDLAGTSRLQQTIGTATSAFNASTVAESSARSADITATSVANRTMGGDTWSEEWNEGYVSSGGWEQLDANASVANGFSSGAGYYNTAAATEEANTTVGLKTAENEAEWNAAFTASAESSSNFVNEEGWTSFSQEKFTETYEETYNDSYSQAYETATTSANQAVSQTATQGTITGSFTTTESGTATAAMEALAESLEDGAVAAAKADLGNTYATREATGTAAGLAEMSENEWNAAYETKYQQEFASAYSAASGSIERKSVSDVDVAGIGVIADVNAASTSKFTAESKLIETAPRDGNGNGNASAGANLATSSYANQNNSTTANAFMQAFSGGLPEATGVETIKSITGTSADGYSVVTDRVSTVRNTTAYTVDGTGNATAGASTDVVQD